MTARRVPLSMRLRPVFAGLAIALAPASVSGQAWSDDFEDYDVGATIAGQGIWRTWTGGTGTAEDAVISDAFASSGDRSLRIVGGNDVVAVFDDVIDGLWVIRAKVYVPSDMSGTLYFLLLNRFIGTQDWSVQVPMNVATGTVHDDFGGHTLPLITDEWIEFVAEIDIEGNSVHLFYGGEPLRLGETWDDTGNLSLEAIDLFSPDGSGAYYDDVSAEKVCVPVKVRREVETDEEILLEGEPSPAYVEGTPLAVTLHLANAREPGGDCPDLGEVTITERLPEGWTATGVSGGGSFSDGAVTWTIPAAELDDGTLGYEASGPAPFANVSIVGTVVEEGNPHVTHVRGKDIPTERGLLDDGSIVRWLILGPYLQNVIESGDASRLEQDFLSDGNDIYEDSVRPVAGDEVDTDYGLPVSAALGLAGPAQGATRPDLNPDGIPQWFAWRDRDAQISFDDPQMWGGDVDDCMAYAVCYLDVREEMPEVYIACGSDDGISLLLDGETIWTNPVLRAWPGFVDVVGPLDLSPGVHILMAKIFERGGGWNFGVRIEDADRAPLVEGYTVCLNPEGCGAPPGVPRFVRGDTDGGGTLTIGDGIQILERLFSGRAAFASDCDDAGDTDDTGSFTIGDAIMLFNYLFGGGAPPAAPFPECGEDPTPATTLGPCNYPQDACR